MKKTLLTLVIVLTGMWAQATLYPLYSINSDPGTTGIVQDGNSFGNTFTAQVNAQSWERVVAAAVTLNIAGGWNGDLYAYLLAPDGTVAIRLFDPTANLTGTSMNVTLTSFDMTDTTHFSVNGTYPGSQTLTPFSGQSIQGQSATALTGGNTYGSLDTMYYGPNTPYAANDLTPLQYAALPAAAGSWTLWLADNTTDNLGDHQLLGWSLTLAVVPEPVTMSLGLFTVMLLALAGVKRCWQPPTETK
jgi:subtilisin-like proprotein convertase family protein